MPARTEEEVQAEIKTLEELKPKVPQRSSFGDNNWAIIDAQIETLRERYDQGRIDQVWGEVDIHLEAVEALHWRLGNSDDAPSKAWSSLVGVKPKYIGQPPISDLNKIKPKTGKKSVKTAAKARKQQRKLTGKA